MFTTIYTKEIKRSVRIMKTKLSQQPAAQSGIFKIGGDTPVHRLGFGAMRLTGKGIWGEPEDAAECIAVLRRAVDLGINLIDTADSYGPFVSERLIVQALHPYPKGGVIATKAGLQRSAPDQWEPDGRPEYLLLRAREYWFYPVVSTCDWDFSQSW